MSILLLVSSYMKVMNAEKPPVKALMGAHLAELMADAELYGWEAVCTFHATWLHQIEQGHAS